MKFHKSFGLIFVCGLILVGCASTTPQADRFLAEPAFNHGLRAIEISNVPFIEQTEGHCGPASLAMALQWSGLDVSAQEIASQVYTPGMKGSLQNDLISAARRQGRLAVPIRGLTDLFEELRAGHPVIVFENLALSWLPQWHYAVVFGYDPKEQAVLMHSGPEAHKKWDLRKFERSWKLADYWGLVILPPHLLAASADEIAHMTAAAGLEQSGRTREAQIAYEKILERWPQSLGAHIGLANLALARSDFHRAVGLLRAATNFHPDSAAAWHNLALAQGAVDQPREARVSARKALHLASAREQESYRRHLKKWIEEN